MQKVIGIVGPKHSGSTMLYNMTRIIYEKMGYTVDSCYITHFYLKDYNHNAQILIVKCHDYDYELDKVHDILLLPLRDFRDCSLSWKKIYHLSASDIEIIDNIIDNISRFKSWEHKSFILRYEDYKLNPSHYLDQLTFILGIKMNANLKKEILLEVYSIYRDPLNPIINLSNQKEYEQLLQDEDYKKTLTTQNHNTSNGIINKYKIEMNSILQQKISKNNYISNVLKQFGYST